MTSLDLRDVALRKWSMPTLWGIGEDRARFSEIAERVRLATDRALSMALRSLTGAELVGRELVDGYPPTAAYAATRAGRVLGPVLAEL